MLVTYIFSSNSTISLLLQFNANFSFFTGEDIPSSNDSLESDDPQAPPRVDYVLSYISYLSEAQKQRVVSFIQEIRPEITIFVAVMQKRNIQPPGPFLVKSLL